MTAFEKIREYVFGLEIIDTHEHLPGFERGRSMQTDILAEYLSHYMSSDVVSAGLAPVQLQTVLDSGRPLMKRWKLVEPFWEAARLTGYGRALDIAARDLYGFDRIDGRTIAPLNEAFVAARAAGGMFRKVLRDMSRIRLGILDRTAGDWDKEFFTAVVRLDDFVRPGSPRHLEALAQQAGAAAIHTLDDLEDACEQFLERSLARGVLGLKCGLAYVRSLRFEKVPPAAAQEEFARIFSDRYITRGYEPPASPFLPSLQDHMMHHICRLADRRGLLMQVHTGLQEGNGNYIHHSDPSLLVNLFMEYRDIRFDIFHIGYPYQQMVALLAKNFRNVFVDFAWAQIASPTAAVMAMAEYLDAVPANKISAFGGDFLFIDGVYGHQHIARTNVARALASKIDAGMIGLDEAKHLAKMVLHDNPVAIFGLQKHLKRSNKSKK